MTAKIEYLFPTFLIKFPFDKHTEYQNLFDHVSEDNISERVPKKWTARLNTNYGFDDNLLSVEKFKLLEKHVFNCVISNLPCKNFQLSNFWYNIYKRDFYQESHHHCDIGTVLSGIYFHKNTTPPQFINPEAPVIGAMGYHSLLDKTWFSKTRKSHHTPEVKDGDIIVFPSDLIHEVPRYDKDGLRITFSFNLFVVPSFN